MAGTSGVDVVDSGISRSYTCSALRACLCPSRVGVGFVEVRHLAGYHPCYLRARHPSLDRGDHRPPHRRPSPRHRHAMSPARRLRPPQTPRIRRAAGAGRGRRSKPARRPSPVSTTSVWIPDHTLPPGTPHRPNRRNVTSARAPSTAGRVRARPPGSRRRTCHRLPRFELYVRSVSDASAPARRPGRTGSAASWRPRRHPGSATAQRSWMCR